MAWRLVKNPKGLWNIFSTVVDDFVYYDCTDEEIVEVYQEKAKQEAKEQAEYAMTRYNQGFRVLKYEEALDIIERNHGDYDE